MNNRFVINYTPGPTAIHRLNGKTKVLAFIALTMAIIATFDFRVMVVIFVFCMACIVSMKPNWKPVLFMFLFLLVMNGVIGSLMLFLITPGSGYTKCGGETIIWRISEKLFISKELLWYGWAMFFKRVVSLSSAIAFVLSITPSELASGLNGIGVPYKICTIISLAFRSIPDIMRDFSDIKNSMQMRGVELDGRKVKLSKKLKQYVLLLVPLIMSSFNKVENISNSMDLRSFGKKKKRTWYSEKRPTKADCVARVVTALIFAWAIFYIIWFRNLHAPLFEYWCPWIPYLTK